jgi:addiction module HigA family antidote
MITLRTITPGEILKEEFLEPLGVTAYRLATDTGMAQTRVSEIVRGKREITLDTAMRLARYFGTSINFWMNLQLQYELRSVDQEMTRHISAIVPLLDSKRATRSHPIDPAEPDKTSSSARRSRTTLKPA